MDTLLKLKKVNLKYQTDKDTIKVLNDIDLITKKKIQYLLLVRVVLEKLV